MNILNLRNLSLRSQITSVVLFFLLIGATALFIMLDQQQHSNLLTSYGNTTVSTVQNHGAHLQVHIEKLRMDVLFLSKTSPVQALVHSKKTLDSSNWKTELGDIFKAFAHANTNYYQLRFIGVKNGGEELVRVERSVDSERMAPPDLLQNKGNQGNFIATQKYKAGDVYLSEINLNRDYGQVTVPHIQTIRATAPVFDSEENLIGLVSINMNIGRYLDEFMHSLPSGITGYITNKAGDYLAHPDPNKVFAFDLGQQYRWQDDFPTLTLQGPELGKHTDLNPESSGITLQNIQTAAGLWHMVAGKVHIDPDNPEQYISMIYGFADNLIQQNEAPLKHSVLIGVISLTLLIALVVFFSVKRMFKPLKELTTSLDHVVDGQLDVALPQGSSSELKLFVRAFKSMADSVQQHEQKILSLNETLTKSETRYRKVVEASFYPVIVHNSEHVIFVNSAALSFFGTANEEDIVGVQITNLIHPDHHELVGQRLRSIMHGEIIDGEWESLAQRLDGSHAKVRASSISMAFDGSPAILTQFRDITEEEKAKEALIESKEQSNLILDSAGEGIYGIDSDGNTTFVNAAAAQMLGYTQEELIGQPTHTLIHHTRADGSSYPKDNCPMYAALLDGKIHTVTNEVLWRKDGSSLPVEYTSTPIRKNDVLIGAVITFNDITLRIEAEAELRKEHALNQQLLGAIPSILIGVDGEGFIALWNQAAVLTFGITSAEAMDSHFSRLAISWDFEAIDEAFVASRAEGTSRVDNVTFQRPDGSDGILGLTINSIFDNSIDNGFLLLGSDITKRLKLEGQLQLAQKMEAIGELAAGIAHEINTPLQYVGDNIRFLKESFSEMCGLRDNYYKLIQHCETENFAEETIKDLKAFNEEADIDFIIEEIPPAISQSLDGVNKASRIVAAMKEFSHPGQKEKMLTDINKILDSTATVAKNEWKYVAKLKTEFDEQLPLVKCLPEINQVFLNMIVNAAHAITEKLDDNSTEKGEISIHTTFNETHIEIRIRDTGRGIPAGHLNKIFDPFFTTKEVGKGTGQGLAISHNIIVELHQGTLEVESEEGIGTTFIIQLPIAQEEV